MPKVHPDKSMTDMMDDGENVHRYRPGGVHPVHIGDLLNGIRYRVVHKLGHGASLTVWLARDFNSRKYIVVKIKESNLSNLHNKADILNHLSRTTSDHPGRIYSAASLNQRHFWIDGSNG